MVRELKTKAEFDECVKNAEKGKLVAVDFTATWCGPCRMIGPKFVEMADEFKDIAFFKVDVDENEEVAASEGISAMPTFKFYRDGKKVDELVGASEEGLRAKLVGGQQAKN